jgi:Zn-dependent protease
MDRTKLAYAFAWYFIFIISATIHEAAHAWAAKRGGDLTAYAGGQVTLNPWPHIKRAPMGMVVIPVISIFLIGWPFGWAKTPVDAHWAYQNPRKSALVSVVGPAANLLLAIIAILVIEIGIHTGFFLAPNVITAERLVDPSTAGLLSGLAIFFSMLFSMNLILFIFNLIPLPPLDGSNIIALFLKDESARKYSAVISNPAFSLIGLLVAWRVFAPVFDIIFSKLLNVIYWNTGYTYSAWLFRFLFS